MGLRKPALRGGLCATAASLLDDLPRRPPCVVHAQPRAVARAALRRLARRSARAKGARARLPAPGCRKRRRPRPFLGQSSTARLCRAQIAHRLKGASSRALHLALPETQGPVWQVGDWVESVTPVALEPLVAYVQGRRAHPREPRTAASASQRRRGGREAALSERGGSSCTRRRTYREPSAGHRRGRRRRSS
jgi:hypothetical protein